MSNHGSLGRIDLQSAVEFNEQISNSFNPSHFAIQNVAAIGIKFPGLPTSGYQGEMPPNITSLNDEALGVLLADSSQYVGYIEVELAKAEVEMNAAQAALDYVSARIRLTLRGLSKEETGGRLSEKDKTDMVITEPRVVEAQKKADYWTAVYRILRAIRDRSQRDWESISRRITQRGQDIQRQVRQGSVAGAPMTPPQWRKRNGG